jgi:hypothetical protein
MEHHETLFQFIPGRFYVIDDHSLFKYQLANRCAFTHTAWTRDPWRVRGDDTL